MRVQMGKALWGKRLWRKTSEEVNEGLTRE